MGDQTTAPATSKARDTRVVTVVLNTNRRDDTLECLKSLDAQTVGSANHVIVLDNKSVDGSVEAIRESYPAVEILSIDTDAGYAGNNNVGIRAALARSPEWVFIVNEDTVLDPACLERLLGVGQIDPSIGILGPLVLHHNEPTVIQSAGGRLTRFWEAEHIGANQRDEGQFGRPQSVDWVSGCSILVRRGVIEDVGFLDERFYYYWEETEWCVRARKRGWRIVNVPAARLWHKGVQRHYRPSTNVTYYNTRNRFLLLATHRPSAEVWLVAWAQTLRTLLSLSVRPRWKSQRAHRDAIWQGTADFLSGRLGVRGAPSGG